MYRPIQTNRLNLCIFQAGSAWSMMMVTSSRIVPFLISDGLGTARPRSSNRSGFLLDSTKPHALQKDLLRSLRAQVRVRRLLLDEDAANLAELRVDLRNFEVDAALVGDELLVVLLEELIIASCLHRRQSDRLVVAGRGTAALRVQEKPGAVRRHLELAGELGRPVDIVGVGLCHELLDREEEGHALTARQLHRRRCVVDAVLLPEGKLASLRRESALNAGQRVSLASRNLGVHRLRHKPLLRELFLENLEARRLEAEVLELVSAANRNLRALSWGLDARARVRKASALDLLVRERRDLGLREGPGRRGLRSEQKGS